MGKPHALYVAWGFPPCRGSGVYRALATANALVAGGFEVTVLTCDRETFFHYTRADTSLEDLVHPDIDVVRVPFEWHIREQDVRRWNRKRARDPQGWNAWRLAEDVKEFPEIGYGPWRGPIVRAAELIHRRRPVDVTVATANPNVAIEAAHQLHSRHGVPYIMDQRDAWTLDVFTEKETEDQRVAAIEREFVHDAHEAWFVNEPLRAWHAARYPAAADRIHSVSNGYDEELAPLPRLSAAPANRPLTFGFLGTITKALPLTDFADGWTVARERNKDVADATAELWGYLGFYARQDPALAAQLKERADAGIRYCGPVVKTGVRDTYARFDVLLLILGTGRYVTSGKVFEYMASGLPVVSVHHPAVDASRVLEGYPLWFRAEALDADSIAAAVGDAAYAARTADRLVRERCVRHARTYERRRQLMPRVEALHRFVTREGCE